MDEIILKSSLKNSRVGKGNFTPQASHGTVLDTLTSYGSYYPALSFD
jgi:hypothetical protein